DQVVDRGGREDGEIENLAGLNLLLQHGGKAVADGDLVVCRALELRRELLHDRLETVGTQNLDVPGLCRDRTGEQNRDGDPRRRHRAVEFHASSENSATVKY